MPSASPNSSGPGLPTDFAAVLSAAIAQRNLTLDRIAQHLRESGTPISIATLSYWQTGRSLPTRTRSLMALRELEKVLRVPDGGLTGALPQGANRNPRISGALIRIGFNPDPDFANQTLQDSIEFSLARTTQSETTRQLLRAETACLHRIPLVLRQEASSRCLPVVEPVAGCSLGDVTTVDNGLVIAELKLSHPLSHGETAQMEYRVVWDIADDEDFGFARVLPRPIDHLAIDVHFLDRRPRLVTYTVRPGAENEDQHPASQQLEPTRLVQLSLTDPIPGVHQLGWEF